MRLYFWEIQILYLLKGNLSKSSKILKCILISSEMFFFSSDMLEMQVSRKSTALFDSILMSFSKCIKKFMYFQEAVHTIHVQLKELIKN